MGKLTKFLITLVFRGSTVQIFCVLVSINFRVYFIFAVDWHWFLVIFNWFCTQPKLWTWDQLYCTRRDIFLSPTKLKFWNDFCVPLHKMCENTGFHWAVFSRIRTKSTTLSLYGRIRVCENLHYRIFYTVSATKIGGNTINILNCFFVLHKFTLWWIKRKIYI